MHGNHDGRCGDEFHQANAGLVADCDGLGGGRLDRRGAIKGEPLGFTMLGSAGLAEHVKLGLLMSAANVIEGEQLRERLGLPKPPEPPPF